VTSISNQVSRRVEARADATALRLAGGAGADSAEAFVGFQRRIDVQNVSEPDPPGWLHTLLGTHPTTVQRIGIAERYATTDGR